MIEKCRNMVKDVLMNIMSIMPIWKNEYLIGVGHKSYI
jgi:hypothetical protein